MNERSKPWFDFKAGGERLIVMAFGAAVLVIVSSLLYFNGVPLADIAAKAFVTAFKDRPPEDIRTQVVDDGEFIVAEQPKVIGRSGLFLVKVRNTKDENMPWRLALTLKNCVVGQALALEETTAALPPDLTAADVAATVDQTGKSAPNQFKFYTVVIDQ